MLYFSSAVGGDDEIHAIRVAIRQLGFEPTVIHELKAHQKRRSDSLETQALIEKPNGCDISLATRMVADAAANLFDACCLFSSDADFLPAVEAVRRMGKVVMVAGYKSAAGRVGPRMSMCQISSST